MWKGVKGLWNVIKPYDRLPSSRVESDDEVPAEWFGPAEEEDDTELESDNSPCCVSTSSLAKTTLQPKTFFLAVEKDPTSLQHRAEIQQRTHLVPIKLSIYLVGDSLWVDCEKGYNSSTYKPAQSKSKQCKLESTTQCADCLIGFVERSPGCNRDACYNIIENPLAEILSRGEILTDLFQIYYFRSRFQNNSSQLLNLFLSRKFGICLSSSIERNGIIFIGNSPYMLNGGFDALRDLICTPILNSPYDIVRDKKISEYYIKVSSISINGKNVPLNKTLLSLEKKGGTNISTDLPYTMLATSIYNAVTKAFVAAIPKEVRSVPPVEPFTTCFNSRDIRISRLGFNAPEINIGLHKKKVHWTITGANSLVKVNEDVVCLAFVERRTID
ncbi:hypothetical protein CQW23_03317 [Capsicum baccatum]|uniref:Peptidase A1 domain-containing protein n=1 Tax=Capsicum baccatum TaxID=33114 RepID=A0A2G2XBV4_CAPBA|nr:hypothetical protein CQW23_03317 [Capsicum baccatum]